MQQEMLNRLATVTGVSSAAITTSVPMSGDSSNDPIYAEDHTYREGSIPPIRRFKHVSPGYPGTMGARMVAGRDITWNEVYNFIPVAMISENMARELWSDPRLAIGKRIRVTPNDDWRTVVGVIGDERSDGVNQKAPASVYWPILLKNFEGNKLRAVRYVAFVIRTPRAGSASFLEEARRAVWSVNPNLPLATVKTLQDLYDASLARTSFTLLLLAISGGMALLLGVVGIYGVISYSVAQRTREIGIRLALGAPLSEVTGMFVWHGLVLSAIGAACGLGAAFALTRLMKSLLFEVSAADPLTYGAVSVVLIAAAIVASYLPARRATTIDPSEALRAE
jgi:predicted permease